MTLVDFSFRVQQSIDCTKYGIRHISFINSIWDIHLIVISNMERSRRLQTQASLDIMADQVRFKSWVIHDVSKVTFDFGDIQLQ